MYYPCSENKGTDQVCNYCEADLRLCFCKCKMLVFSWGGSIVVFCENLPINQGSNLSRSLGRNFTVPQVNLSEV